jgi:hypothetical protein
MCPAPEDHEVILSGDALAAFRHAVEHHIDGANDIEDLKATLRAFCASARREACPPEQMIISVKLALDDLRSARGEAPSMRDEIRNRIVSLAIRSFYASQDGEAT